MDLKNKKITLGELLDNPQAKALLTQRFPMALRKPLTGAARSVTLEQLIAVAGSWVPGAVIHDTLRELERL